MAHVARLISLHTWVHSDKTCSWSQPSQQPKEVQSLSFAIFICYKVSGDRNSTYCLQIPKNTAMANEQPESQYCCDNIKSSVSVFHSAGHVDPQLPTSFGSARTAMPLRSLLALERVQKSQKRQNCSSHCQEEQETLIALNFYRKSLWDLSTELMPAQQAGELWRQLSDETRKPFETQAKVLKAEYVEFSAFNQLQGHESNQFDRGFCRPYARGTFHFSLG